MDRRKSKTKIKHGISSRGTSDRLKQQSVNDRALKRSEMTKRFRGTGDVTDTHESVELSLEALHMVVLSIKTMDESTLLRSMKTLRQFMSSEDAPIQAVVESGVIENLIQILSCSNVALIPDVLWCLSNIATGNHTQTGAVLRVVPALLNILQGSHNALLSSLDSHVLGGISLEEDSCWTIGNIAGDSDEYRSALLEQNVLQPIIKFLQQSLTLWTAACQISESQLSHSVSAAQHLGRAGTAVWTLSNIARGATPGNVFINSGFTGPLIELLKHEQMQSITTVKMVTEINWLFAFLTAKEDSTVSALINEGLIEVFVRVAFGLNADSMESVPCVRILINISSGPVEWTESLLGQEALLPALLRLSDVRTAHRAVAKESLMLLCHLLGGSEGARRCVLQSTFAHALLSNIAHALLSDIFELQREAIYAMHAACLDLTVARSTVFTVANVLSEVVRLLQVQDISVSLCCLDVLRLLSIEPNTVKTLGDLGLYDILDSIQYGPGDANMRQVARLLAEDLFEKDEDEEQEHLSSASSVNSAPEGLYGGIRGFGSNDHRGSASESSTSTSTSICPPDRESGVGRGSHLNRPAWMVPN